jgi:hypothetical protein
VSWPPRSSDFSGGFFIAVYAYSVDTRQQLRQRIQDTTNEIRATPGVFELVRDSF